MKFERASGILLHPTSLPGPYGIGDIGPEAYRWVKFLVDTGCSLWQVLPLGPTGYGDSPYQCFSAFAGNPYLVSLQNLLELLLLNPQDLSDMPVFAEENVDYGKLIPWKIQVLDRAYERYQQGEFIQLKEELDQFKSKNEAWLPDYALFMALKDAHEGAPWVNWEKSLRDREASAVEHAQAQYRETIQKHIFRQFIFFRQWLNLRTYANDNGIKIIGDIPIFVAHDSAEVWANRELFFIDKEGNPTVVAGVPPDYFSPTGQRWGNPLYRWMIHAQQNYQWWINRFNAVFELVDIVRLDHFRGFAGYWEIPAEEETAEEGRWVKGPGAEFFEKMESALGELPIIAEDLGEITQDVIDLREEFEFPGMKILVFAFTDNASNEFLPHNYKNDCVVYTGTHDNDTVIGWYNRVSKEEKDFARRYLGRSGEDIAWDLIRTGWSSVATLALAQMQDVLRLDNEARMNYPSRPSGNWQWRMKSDAIQPWHKQNLRELNSLYLRGKPPAEDLDEETEEDESSKKILRYEESETTNLG